MSVWISLDTNLTCLVVLMMLMNVMWRYKAVLVTTDV